MDLCQKKLDLWLQPLVEYIWVEREVGVAGTMGPFLPLTNLFIYIALQGLPLGFP